MHPYLILLQIVAGIFSTCCPFHTNTVKMYPRNITKIIFNFKILKNKNKNWLQLSTQPQSPLPQITEI